MRCHSPESESELGASFCAAVKRSIRKLVTAGVASEVHYKEQYISNTTLAGESSTTLH